MVDKKDSQSQPPDEYDGHQVFKDQTWEELCGMAKLVSPDLDSTDVTGRGTGHHGPYRIANVLGTPLEEKADRMTIPGCRCRRLLLGHAGERNSWS